MGMRGPIFVLTALEDPLLLSEWSLLWTVGAVLVVLLGV